MKTFAIFSAGLSVCLLSLIGCQTDNANRYALSVYVVGDSISIDYHPYLKAQADGIYGYDRKGGLELAKADLDRPRGANGGDSSMVLDFLRESLGDRSIRANYILINCGLHDIKTNPQTGERQVPLPEYRTNLRAIIDLVRSKGKKPVWITTTPVAEAIHQSRPDMPFHRYEADLSAYNAAAREIMEEMGVPVIDLHQFTLSLDLPPGELYRDHVHFPAEISEKQAGFIHHWILGHLIYKRAGV